MTEVLTHSKRQAFLNCPRYFYHRHEQHLRHRSSRAGRRRGTVFGNALQEARDFIETTPDVLGAIEVALDSIDLFYDRAQDEGAVADQEDADDLEVEQAKMHEVVKAYIGRYGLKARREVEFYRSLLNPEGRRTRTFSLGGKIDGMEIVGTKVARIVEDKLVGSVQQAMIQRLPLDAQSSEYVDALMEKGWSAEVAYRHTRWPGINPTKAKVLKTMTHPAETRQQFQERLAADIVERGAFYFDEQILVFPAVHLEDYRNGRWGVARMIQDARIRAKHHGPEAGFPMNPSRCWEYGGCEFIPLCCKDEGAADLYVVDVDNPELSDGQTGS